MKAVDIIGKYIEDHRLTQSEAARMVGMTRQNFWQKMNSGNMQFRTFRRIAEAFGFRIQLAMLDGSPVYFNTDRFISVCESSNVCWDTLERILRAQNIKLSLIEK